MKTWSDVLEELRAQYGDISDYDWIVPIQLLNTTFDPFFAESKYAELSTIPSYCGRLMVVAWSSSYVYVLLSDDETPYLAAVRRNPPI